MTIRIEQCSNEQKQVLHNLYQFYLHDLSSFTEENRIEQNGLFLTEHINVFWEKENLYPYFIYLDDELSGFVLVAGKPFVPEGTDYSIVEFFVLREKRRTGVGREAAHLVFESFRGTWDVFELETNTPAIAFWTNVISEYTKGNYESLGNRNQQRFANL